MFCTGLFAVANYSNAAKGAKRFAVKAPHDNTPAHVAVETGGGTCDVSACVVYRLQCEEMLSPSLPHTDTPKAVNFPIS